MAPIAGQPMPPSNAPAAEVVAVRTAAAQPTRQPSDFVDPAILSYSKSPAPRKVAAQEVLEPVTPMKSMLAKAAESLPVNGSPFIGEAGTSSPSRKPSQAKETATAGTREAVQPHSLAAEADGTQENGLPDTNGKKKVRRGQKKKGVNGTADPPQIMNVEVSRNGNDMEGGVKRGKGWRQTPLLQPSPQTGSSSHKGSVRKSRKEAQEANQNGWATEDATDIQGMDEFDFEANHKLFDKKTVFDQLRQGDTTADEDRLVGHNRVVHRPGTYGGKNLHPTENVLSPQVGPRHNSNELDSTSDADTELNFPMNNGGRSSSRQSSSRTAMKKQPSRQNSSQVEPRAHPLASSISSDRAMSRSRAPLPTKSAKPMPSIATSILPERTQSPHSAISNAKTPIAPQAAQAQEAHLAIYPTWTPCPVLHPTALETLEKETTSRYGLTPDAITESAARCIAETAMSVFHSATNSRRGSRANTLHRGTGTNTSFPTDPTAPPVVVIIAGNHAVGARAVAAARHLVSRKTHVILAEAQYESSDTQDLQMKTQTSILKRMVKRGGAPIQRGPWRRASAYIKNLPSPPAVIIDALLAGSTYESLLDSSNATHVAEAQREAREMIDWANRSRAPVLSIACPSGVSGIDGTTTTVEGEPLAVRPEKVLCLAAPMLGVLEAMRGGERWDVSLGDVGVNIALRSDEAVAFGGRWVVEVKIINDGEEGSVEG